MNKHAQSLGRLGGKAGRGKAKCVMKTKSPRYKVEPWSDGHHVIDTSKPTEDERLLAILQSEDAAESVCARLNRGLCQTIAPDGRWTS